jgi:hypothetical protein
MVNISVSIKGSNIKSRVAEINIYEKVTRRFLEKKSLDFPNGAVTSASIPLDPQYRYVLGVHIKTRRPHVEFEVKINADAAENLHCYDENPKKLITYSSFYEGWHSVIFDLT